MAARHAGEPAEGVDLERCISALDGRYRETGLGQSTGPDSEAVLEELLNAAGRTAEQTRVPRSFEARGHGEVLARPRGNGWIAIRPPVEFERPEDEAAAESESGGHVQRSTEPGTEPGEHRPGEVCVYGLDGVAEWRPVLWAGLRRRIRSVWRVHKIAGNGGNVVGEQAESQWGWLTRPLRRQRNGYGLAIGASVFGNLLAVAGSFYALHVYDRVVPTGATSTLWALTIGVAIAYTFEFVLQLLRSYFLDHSGKSLDREVSRRLFSRALGMQMRVRPDNAGVFSSHFREFESIRDFLSSLTLATLIDLPFTFFFIAVIGLIAGPVAFVPLVAVPIVIGSALALQIPLARAVDRAVRGAARKQGMLVESLAGIETIKALGLEPRLKSEWGEVVDETAESARESRLISTLATGGAKLIQQFVYAGVIVAGVYLTLDQRLTMGGIIACSILVGRAMQPLAQLSGLLTRAQQVRHAAGQVQKIAQLPLDVPAGRKYVRRPRITGDVSFSHVTFTYPGQEVAVLRDVSVSIRAGERVGIAGRSGSGKSTFLRLLMGLYEPDSGSVTVGGVNNCQIAPAELRASIGFLGQDGFLFNGTIADNIAHGAVEASDEDIVMAARLAGVEDFTASTAEGLYARVGEMGRYLSGGQRQAVCLARALIRQGAMLMLDEPSNSLDHGNEQRLRAALSRRPEDETLLLVTHHATLFEHVDRLLVFEKGRIMLDGPRDEVMSRLRSSAATGGDEPGAKGADH